MGGGLFLMSEVPQYEKRPGQLGNERIEVIRHRFRDALTDVFPWWSLPSRDNGLRPQQTSEPLVWHWSHWPGILQAYLAHQKTPIPLVGPP